MDAAVAALLGAGIGAVGSLGAAWLQQKYQASRDLVQEAVRIGLADYADDMRRAEKVTGTAFVAPPAAYVAYHSDVLRAIVARRLTPEAMKQIQTRHQQVLAAIAGNPDEPAAPG